MLMAVYSPVLCIRMGIDRKLTDYSQITHRWGIDGKDKKFILEKDNGFIYDTQLDCHFFSFCVNY